MNQNQSMKLIDKFLLNKFKKLVIKHFVKSISIMLIQYYITNNCFLGKLCC